MGQIVYAFSDSGCVGPYLLCFSYALAAIRSEARSNAYCVEDRRRQLGWSDELVVSLLLNSLACGEMPATRHRL